MAGGPGSGKEGFGREWGRSRYHGLGTVGVVRGGYVMPRDEGGVDWRSADGKPGASYACGRRNTPRA